MPPEIDTVLEWQFRGMNARKVGIPKGANPLLLSKPETGGLSFDMWLVKFEAWCFGWAIEDCFVTA